MLIAIFSLLGKLLALALILVVSGYVVALLHVHLIRARLQLSRDTEAESRARAREAIAWVEEMKRQQVAILPQRAEDMAVGRVARAVPDLCLEQIRDLVLEELPGVRVALNRTAVKILNVPRT